MLEAGFDLQSPAVLLKVARSVKELLESNQLVKYEKPELDDTRLGQ